MPNKISIKQAAETMGKCQQFVRVGLQRGLLPFGTAVKVTTRWNYYISPKLFQEYVGCNNNEFYPDQQHLDSSMHESEVSL